MMQTANLNQYTDDQLWEMINSDPTLKGGMRPPQQYQPQPPPPPQPQPVSYTYPPTASTPAMTAAPPSYPAEQQYTYTNVHPPGGNADMQHNGFHSGVSGPASPQPYAPSPMAQPPPAQQYGTIPQYQQPQQPQPPQYYPQTQTMYPPPAAVSAPPPVPSRPSHNPAFSFNQPPPPPSPYGQQQQQQQQYVAAEQSMSRGSSANSMSPHTPTTPPSAGSPHSEHSPNGERTPPGGYANGPPQQQHAGLQSTNPAVQKLLATKSVDLAFCVDCTGSMKQWLDFVKAKVVAIANAVKKDPRVVRVRLAFVGYRDYVYPADQRYVIINFIDNAEQFALSIRDVPALYCTGNDEPEDLLGGLNACLTKLDWQSKCKIVILITDAPCHGGKDYHDLKENPNNASYKDPLRPDTLLRAMSDRFAIDLTFCRIKSDTDRMVGKFQTFYNNPAKRKQLEVIELTDQVDDFMAKIVKTVTQSVNRANK